MSSRQTRYLLREASSAARLEPERPRSPREDQSTNDYTQFDPHGQECYIEAEVSFSLPQGRGEPRRHTFGTIVAFTPRRLYILKDGPVTSPYLRSPKQVYKWNHYKICKTTNNHRLHHHQRHPPLQPATATHHRRPAVTNVTTTTAANPTTQTVVAKPTTT